LLPATPNHAQLIAKFPLGLNGANVTRHAEEENNHVLEPSPPPPLLEDNHAQPLLKYKIAMFRHAQLTVLLQLGVCGQLVTRHVVPDHNLGQD